MSTFSVRFMDEKIKCTNPILSSNINFEIFAPKDALYLTLSGDPNPSNSIHVYVALIAKKLQHSDLTGFVTWIKSVGPWLLLPAALKKEVEHFTFLEKCLNNIQ